MSPRPVVLIVLATLFIITLVINIFLWQSPNREYDTDPMVIDSPAKVIFWTIIQVLGAAIFAAPAFWVLWNTLGAKVLEFRRISYAQALFIIVVYYVVSAFSIIDLK